VTPDPVLCVQSALLYTNSDGERRIRVHTWACLTTQNYTDIIGSVDVQATITMLSQISLEHSLKTNLTEGRNRLNTQCQQLVQLMNMSPNSEALQFLPLYIMGMLKSPAFRATNDISADLRTYIWMRLETLTVSQLASYYYPRLMALHNIPDTCGVPDEQGRITLPDMLNLTKDIMTPEGIYLLEDGEMMMIWIGRAAAPGFLQAVFGNGNIDELDTGAAEAMIGTACEPERDALSRKIGLIVRQVRAERSVPYMQLQIIKGGDGQKEARFFSSLIEDSTHALPTTYMQFLQRMGYRAPAQSTAPPPRR